MISQFDRDNVGAILSGHGDWFTAKLLRLCAKADPENLERIRKGFPDVVETYEKWLYEREMSALDEKERLRDALERIEAASDGESAITLKSIARQEVGEKVKSVSESTARVRGWWVCECGHRNSGFAAACYGGCGKDCPETLHDAIAQGLEVHLVPRPSAARDRDDYQIALRCNDLGLDDVVVKDVAMFRMERMDNGRVWLCCYLSDGQSIDFDLWSDGNIVKYAAREFDLPTVVYEEGSRAH